MAKKKRTDLSEPESVFVAAMIERHNATRAYQLAYPNCKANTAATNGWRMLRNAKVRTAIAEGRRAKLEALEMKGTEALQRIALIARADVRQLFDEDGKLLPVHEWPDELALAVKSVKDKPWGKEISFDSRLSALEIVAEADGTLKKSLNPDDVLSLLLAHATPEDEARARGAAKR